jgi:hypothetical protein
MGGVIKSVGQALGFQNSSEGLQGSFTDAQKRAADALKAQQANETSFANQLAQGALGQGPSVVDMQLKAAQDRTLAQQLAAARSTRSVNPALAMRNIQQAAGQQNAELAQAGATGRIQEQRAQQSDYGNYLNNLRNAELNTLNASAANARASDQASNAFGSSLIGAAGSIGASMASAAPAAAAASDENMKKQILNAGVPASSELSVTPVQAMTEIEPDLSAAKTVDSLAKSAVGFLDKKNKPVKKETETSSDENNKKNVKTGEAKSFLDALTPYTYKYKDAKQPGAGEGKFLGVMAQDLEKAGDVGRSMVKDTPNGKMVDYGKGFGALLATQADINKRLSELESKKKKV